MDVVKTNIERIGGSVEIESRVGQGTTLRVKIPLTLAIIPTLIVVANGERYAIPQVSVREIVAFQPSGAGCAMETIGNAHVYQLRGELLPLVDLRRRVAPSQERDRRTGEFANMVVLQAVSQRCGLVVDRVKNTEEIVVKPLHKTLARLSVFSGATIMGNGRVALILDVAGLAHMAGVMERGQDTADQSAIEVDDTDEIDGHGAGDLLVCLVGRDRLVAVPLPDVARLEEIPVSAIQSSAGQPVTAYRSHIMPLLSLDDAGGIPAGEDGRISVVVHAVGRRYVGLCVRPNRGHRGDHPGTGHQPTATRDSRAHADPRSRGRHHRHPGVGSRVRRVLASRADGGGYTISQVRQYSTFFADRLHFGMAVDRVQEALLPMPATPVPLTTDIVDGLINFRPDCAGDRPAGALNLPRPRRTSRR